jgi:hypothetical protein
LVDGRLGGGFIDRHAADGIDVPIAGNGLAEARGGVSAI